MPVKFAVKFAAGTASSEDEQFYRNTESVAFPKLDDRQLALSEPLGVRRILRRGELVLKAGQRDLGMTVILRGEMEVFESREGQGNNTVKALFVFGSSASTRQTEPADIGQGRFSRATSTCLAGDRPFSRTGPAGVGMAAEKAGSRKITARLACTATNRGALLGRTRWFYHFALTRPASWLACPSGEL